MKIEQYGWNNIQVIRRKMKETGQGVFSSPCPVSFIRNISFHLLQFLWAGDFL